jgi:hypothetical protein
MSAVIAARSPRPVRAVVFDNFHGLSWPLGRFIKERGAPRP